MKPLKKVFFLHFFHRRSKKDDKLDLCFGRSSNDSLFVHFYSAEKGRLAKAALGSRTDLLEECQPP
jgi:hypothetical protein